MISNYNTERNDVTLETYENIFTRFKNRINIIKKIKKEKKRNIINYKYNLFFYK